MKTYILAFILALVFAVAFTAATGDTNAAPVVQSPASGSCVAPCRATLTAQASDPDGSIVLYEWLRGGQVIGSGPNATTLNVTFDIPAEADIDVRVTDNDGGQATATAHVSVTAPPGDTAAPVITSILPADGATVPRTGRVTISAAAADDTAVDRMELYLDGVLVAGASSPSVSYAWKVPGTKGRRYTILAVAFDAAGNAGRATATVTASR